MILITLWNIIPQQKYTKLHRRQTDLLWEDQSDGGFSKREMGMGVVRGEGIKIVLMKKYSKWVNISLKE